ncbi:hypothetical protein Tco_0996194 [Tanacetum coccineum]
MSSSSSIFSNIGNKKECKCRLPEQENEWYRTHLYEMYMLLNPSQRRELETEISSQEEVVLLQLEMQTMRDELSKCQKKAFFWKSAVILFVVVWFVSSMN